AFLLAVVFAGIFQIVLGILRAGVVGYYFPSSVIKGMLAAIGIIIFVQQLPHALGYNRAYAGDTRSLFSDQESLITALHKMLEVISVGAVIVTAVSLFILLLWENVLAKRSTIFKIIPGPLIAV